MMKKKTNAEERYNCQMYNYFSIAFHIIINFSIVSFNWLVSETNEENANQETIN